MANIQSAKKRIRQNEKRRIRNRVYRSSARTYIKKARTQIADGQLDEATETVRLASQALDKAARRRIIHPNNASRRKGRLMASLAAAKKAAA